LSTANDARRSSITGTTLNGPNGSAQYFPVFLSTSVARTVVLGTTLLGAAGSTVEAFYGILQNTPGPGQAADVGIFGISKAIAGTTTIVFGGPLQTSSTAPGYLVPWAGGNGPKIGIAIEVPTGVGQVFTMALYGFGAGPGST
jgi:hypothetical protein